MLVNLPNIDDRILIQDERLVSVQSKAIFWIWIFQRKNSLQSWKTTIIRYSDDPSLLEIMNRINILISENNEPNIECKFSISIALDMDGEENLEESRQEIVWILGGDANSE